MLIVRERPLEAAGLVSTGCKEGVDIKLFLSRLLFMLMKHAEHQGNEEQRGERGHY